MIKVIELFAGIGSQSMALNLLGVEHDVIGIAELNKYSILSYANIHKDLLENLETVEALEPIKMADHLTEKNIGYDFEKDKPYNWYKHIGKDGKAKKELILNYKATIISNNYGDISKIKKLDKADFWTYSFPCQDLSIAGNLKGMNENTRSGLLYQVERLLEVAIENDEAPGYLMLENVKNLVGKQFRADFDKWVYRLHQLGYNTYWKILNAKNYGIPQNRERVFAISIRKDIDNGFSFPEGFVSGLRLKDILEDEVDEKYYLSNKIIEGFLKNNLSDGKIAGTLYNQATRFEESDNAVTLLARDYKGFGNQGMAGVVEIKSSPKRIGNIYGNDKGTGYAGNVWDKDYLSPTLTTMQGGNREPMIIDDLYKSRQPREYTKEAPTLRASKAGELKVLIPQATKKGFIECKVGGVFDMALPNSKTRRGRVQDEGETAPTLTAGETSIAYIEPIICSSRGRNVNDPSDRRTGIKLEQRLELNKDNISNTITTVQKDNYVLEPSYRIRKLTPRECFRLMGFRDQDFDKAEKVCSNSQLYKQAGNSIVVNVLYHIFKSLFTDTGVETEQQLTMF